MTKKDIIRILNRKTIDMEETARTIRILVNLYDMEAVATMVVALERELDAFKMLVNGAKLGQKEETK